MKHILSNIESILILESIKERFEAEGIEIPFYSRNIDNRNETKKYN